MTRLAKKTVPARTTRCYQSRPSMSELRRFTSSLAGPHLEGKEMHDCGMNPLWCCTSSGLDGLSYVFGVQNTSGMLPFRNAKIFGGPTWSQWWVMGVM